MDSNLHHPLWNPPTYTHLHREADDLISMTTVPGLSLRSPSGVPTFYPPHLTHANTMIDLLWASPGCVDWITSCKTDVAHRFSHLSDHAAILTRLDLPTPLPKTQKSYHNWKKLDQAQFKAELSPRLNLLLPTLLNPATNQLSLDHHTDLLHQAVTDVMDLLVPRKAFQANTKRWWDKSTLNPLKAQAQRLRRRVQRHHTETAKKAYIEATQTFRTAIHDTKRAHWRSFLASLTPSTLFTAALYATAEWAAPSAAVPPLRTLAGGLTSEPEEQADLLFRGTSAPTIKCSLDDILPTPPPSINPTLFQPQDIALVISRLQIGKAPGRDDITNQAIKAGGPALAQALCHIENSCLLTTLFPTA